MFHIENCLIVSMQQHGHPRRDVHGKWHRTTRGARGPSLTLPRAVKDPRAPSIEDDDLIQFIPVDVRELGHVAAEWLDRELPHQTGSRGFSHR